MNDEVGRICTAAEDKKLDQKLPFTPLVCLPDNRVRAEREEYRHKQSYSADLLHAHMLSASSCSTGPSHRFTSARGGKESCFTPTTGGVPPARSALKLLEAQQDSRQDLGGGRLLMSRLWAWH